MSAPTRQNAAYKPRTIAQLSIDHSRKAAYFGSIRPRKEPPFFLAAGFSSQTARIGSSVFESRYDATIVNPTASASGANSERLTPTMKNDGMKTAMTANIATKGGRRPSPIAYP